MKKFMIMFITVLFVFVSAMSFVIAQNNNTADKRIVVYLYADGCMSCQQFDKIYSQLKDKFSSSYKFLKVNIASENGAEFARQFGVRAVPYVAFIDNSQGNYMHVSEQCMFDYSCMETNMESFGN